MNIGLGRITHSLWSLTQRVFKPIIRFTFRYVFPPIVSFFRIVSSAGETLYGLRGFLGHIKTVFSLDIIDHPIGLAMAGLAVASNVVVNVVTRIPNIFRQFRSYFPSRKPIVPSQPSSINRLAPDIEALINDDDETEEVNDLFESDPQPTTGWFGTEPRLGLAGNAIYLFSRGLNMCSGLFGAVGNFNNVFTLCQFLIPYLVDTEEEEWNNYVAPLAILIAFSNYTVFMAFNAKLGQIHAERLAERIVQRDFSIERSTILGTSIALPGLFARGFMAYYSTFNAFSILPWVTVPNHVKSLLAGSSAVCAAFTHALTNVAQLNDFIKTRGKGPRFIRRHCLEYPLHYTVIGAMAIDFITVSMMMCVSFANTATRALGDNLHFGITHPGLLPPGIVLGVSSSFASTSLQWWGYMRNCRLYHEARGEVYTSLEVPRADADFWVSRSPSLVEEDEEDTDSLSITDQLEAIILRSEAIERFAPARSLNASFSVQPHRIPRLTHVASAFFQPRTPLNDEITIMRAEATRLGLSSSQQGE